MSSRKFMCMLALFFGTMLSFSATGQVVSYFPEEFVKTTLVKFEVPKEKHDEIVNSLNEKSKGIFSRIREKASSGGQNLFADPAKRQDAIKLFRATQLELFSEAMHANGIDDPEKIKAMFDDIFKQRASQFSELLKRRQKLDAPTD